MKEYKKPVSFNAKSDNVVNAVPAILGLVAGVAAAKAVSKGMDKLFQDDFINTIRLDGSSMKIEEAA